MATLWDQLDDAAGEHPLLALLDTCYAAPKAKLRPILNKSLVVLASVEAHKTAYVTEQTGTWFSQAVVDVLNSPEPVTFEALVTQLRQAATDDGRGEHSDFVAQAGQHEKWTLNPAAAALPALILTNDVLATYRAWAYDTHVHRVPFFEGGLVENLHVDLDLNSAIQVPCIGKRPTLEEVMRTGGRWVVLGEPGAGKSTIARQLTRRLCAADFKSNVIPVYVSLPSIADRLIHPYQFVEQTLLADGAKVSGLADALFKAPKVWLLLDGFDEVLGEHLSKLCGHILRWSTLRTMQNAVFVVLSRPHAFQALDGYHKARVGRLTRDRQQALLDRWIPELANQALAELDDRPVLKELAAYPLLLTLIAIVYRETQALPSSRVSLFKTALGLLLKRGYHVEPQDIPAFKPARRILQHLSLALQRRGGESWDEELLADILDDLKIPESLPPRHPGTPWTDAQTPESRPPQNLRR